MKLTRRQKEILDFIKGFIDLNGYSPSMEEIAAHFRISSLNAVYKHLEALKARGYVRRDANRARSIELADQPGAGSRLLPLFGYVAAGRPIEAVATPESLSVPEDFLPHRGSCYVLRVQGNSMIDEHIEDGDYVVVESREDAQDGDMVVALLDGENVTLKKIYREADAVRLQPANVELPPMRFEPSRVKVQGVVVGVMRRYR
jgi:repressor LexA